MPLLLPELVRVDNRDREGASDVLDGLWGRLVKEIWSSGGQPREDGQNRLGAVKIQQQAQSNRRLQCCKVEAKESISML